MFWKRLAKLGIIQFFNDTENGNNAGLTFVGRPQSGSKRKAICLQQDLGIAVGLAKLPILQRITPGNSAITTGIAAQSNTAIKALTTLTTAAQTITSFAGQPDVARCIRVVAAKTGATAVGDGGFTAANSRYVIVTGTDIHGNTIVEWIPLNDTTAVNGRKAFKTVTSIVLPIRVNSNGGDQVSVGYGLVFGLRRPVALAADVLEFGRKAGAATAYTIETLPTMDVGEATSTLDGDHTASDTTLLVADGSVFTNGSQRKMAAIEHKNGDIEEVIITSRTTNTLTVVRGANGTTALAAVDGCQVSLRPGMTLETTLTAQDRLEIHYLTPVI